jgi:hypothetical protein
MSPSRGGGTAEQDTETASEVVRLLKGSSLRWPEKLQLAKRALAGPKDLFPGRTAVLLEWAVNTLARVGAVNKENVSEQGSVRQQPDS